jgi:hypothetical protein
MAKIKPHYNVSDLVKEKVDFEMLWRPDHLNKLEAYFAELASSIPPLMHNE